MCTPLYLQTNESNYLERIILRQSYCAGPNKKIGIGMLALDNEMEYPLKRGPASPKFLYAYCTKDPLDSLF